MMEGLQGIANFLGADRYNAHSICLTNDPPIVFLYALSNFVIAISYFGISSSLYARRRALVDLNLAAKVMFAAFIWLCGVSHLSMVATLFAGVYFLEVTILAATATVSAVTAVYTVRSLWLPPRAA